MKSFFLYLLLGYSLMLSAADNLLLQIPYTVKAANGKCTVENGGIHLSLPGPGHVEWKIPLNPEWKFLKLELEISSDNLIQGKLGWQNGRTAMVFQNKQGQNIGKWPEVFSVSKTTQWEKCRRVYEIPQGAEFLDFTPANFGVSGKVKFRSMRLTPATGKVEDAEVPTGESLRELWDMKDAWQQKNLCREDICLNGLWQFKEQNDNDFTDRVPAFGSGWGFFKVPGIWPGGFRVAPAQQIIRPEFSVAKINAEELNSAWYRRMIRIPADWSGKRIELNFEMIQSYARIFIDGKIVGELLYPGGKIDITSSVRAGQDIELAVLLIAKPSATAGFAFMGPGRIVAMNAKMAHRGITGDVYLSARPAQGRISDVHIITSVKNKTLTCDIGFLDLPSGKYSLSAQISENKKVVKTMDFQTVPLSGGKKVRTSVSAIWEAPKLWDTENPQNLYQLTLTLKDSSDKIIDILSNETFGFREFELDGRTLKLNGIPLHLRSLVCSAPEFGAESACKEMLQQTADRMKQYGFNHAIMQPYSFNPGAVGYQFDTYNEFSRKGILTSLTMPTLSVFKFDLKNPISRQNYTDLVEFMIRRYQNIPGIVLYAMNHNATGYEGDQDPAAMRKDYNPDADIVKYNARQAQIREAAKESVEIIKSFDASRTCYHHESGRLGDWHTINCYLNWAPRQERSDWFEIWEKEDNHPMFLVEWGIPHAASWSSHRAAGFIWTTQVTQTAWLNEYNAAVLGEDAYHMTADKKPLYDAEHRNKGNKKRWFWANPIFHSEDADQVRAYFLDDNIRAIRARGVTAFLLWDMPETFWTKPRNAYSPVLRDDRFQHLKIPGIMPDYRFPNQWPALPVDPSNMLSTSGKAALNAFTEQLAWIGGKSSEFTEKGHNFFAGETVRKQLILLNDTRTPRSVKYSWNIDGIKGASGSVTVDPGIRKEIPFQFTIPADAAEKLTMSAEFLFDNGIRTQDTFELNVFRKPIAVLRNRIGLFDPENTASPLLTQLGISFTPVKVQHDLTNIDTLIIGRNGLPRSPFIISELVKKGLRVLIMEQSYDTLNQLGFRSNKHGMRIVFGPNGEKLHDWRGSATLLPPYLSDPGIITEYPKIKWSGFLQNHVWRAGNRGTICSIPFEKPPIGGFYAPYSCGFDLQYAPVLEQESGKGRVIFSQFDLCGRTEDDAEAMTLFFSMLRRLEEPVQSKVPFWFSGDQRSENLLKDLGLAYCKTEKQIPTSGVLVVGPGTTLSSSLLPAVKNGLNVVSLGLDSATLNRLFPATFTVKKGDYYPDFIEGLHNEPLLQGITNADFHWHDILTAELFETGKPFKISRIGNGSIAAMQVVPWNFDPTESPLRTSCRRNNWMLSRLFHNLGATDTRSPLPVIDAGFCNGQVISLKKWQGKLAPENAGYENSGIQFKHWEKINVPGAFNIGTLTGIHGSFWYKTEFDLPAEMVNSDTVWLKLGAVDDESKVWLNGKYLGEISKKTHPETYWFALRDYPIPAGLLKTSGNILTVLCNDLEGTGGIMGIPVLETPPKIPFYTDIPAMMDNPYQYLRW